MGELSCDHVGAGEAIAHVRLTGEKSEEVFILCRPCYENALSWGRFNPIDPIGWHIYQSTDPDLPKDQWERLTKTSSTVPRFKVESKSLDPSKEYYFYVTQINSYGLESPPSPVINAESLDDYILGADLIRDVGKDSQP